METNYSTFRKEELKKIALITGITGQDGAYLAKFLLDRNYRIVGCYRRSSTLNFWRLQELMIYENNCLELVDLDITDPVAVSNVVRKHKPHEIYNLAAQSFVTSSFENPVLTANINSLGPLYFLEAIRIVDKNIRFYQASTSEMYGLIQSSSQDENTPFYPRSPYAVSKLYAHWITVNYRESYGVFAACGILFNHESPLRGEEFVTKKITSAVARIKHGIQTTLFLGNLNARRDWGYAADYVEGMWKMLQAEKPENYVLATGKNETIRNFAKLAFKEAGIEIKFRGAKENEVGIDTQTGDTIIRIDKKLYRPAEVDVLLGNSTKANNELNWKARTSIQELAKVMVEYDLQSIGQSIK